MTLRDSMTANWWRHNIQSSHSRTSRPSWINYRC